jgi:hypothetical protein
VNGQCARVLEVLADGQPHSVTELHRLAGTMRLNSRVSELRKHLKERGETIVCTRAGGAGPDSYIYTLISLREGEQEQSDKGTDDACSFSRSETQLVPGDPNHLVPVLSPAGPGHAAADGNRPASSGPAHLFDGSGAAGTQDYPAVAPDIEDLQFELDLIDRKLGDGIVVDSENARSTRGILERQHREIRDKLASA